MTAQPQTLSKTERLSRKTLIDRLFAGGSRSMLAFPLRMVYRTVENDKTDEPVSILISVPKKRFRRAVKRNRVKRQVREAYRRHKHVLIDKVRARESRLILAFIWLDDNLHDSATVEERVINLLTRLSEKLD